MIARNAKPEWLLACDVRDLKKKNTAVPNAKAKAHNKTKKFVPIQFNLKLYHDEHSNSSKMLDPTGIDVDVSIKHTSTSRH